jgi:phosphomannomutase
MAATGDWDSGAGSLTADPGLIDRYVDALLADFRGGEFRIAWDCGNGAAGPVVERLVQRLPGRHHLLFSDVDGRFPNHHPDPTIEANLADLKRAVAEKGCDFGVAFDGDADRIGAVDGRGRVVWGDQLLGILAEPVLRALPGSPIIADIKSSQALFDRIAALGGVPDMWKSGHSLMKERLQQLNAPLAGEMSGHIFFAHRWHGVDDGLLAALRLIEAVAAQGGSLTALKDAMPAMINTPELRLDCPESRKFGVVDEVLARLQASGAQVNAIDGARVMRADGWWLLRASNTQAALTARVEAKNAAALARLLAELNAELALSGIEPVQFPP